MDAQKVQHKYGSGAGYQIQSWPPSWSKWDIDGTGDRDGVEPKLRSKSYNTNIDLDLDMDVELIPPQNWLHFGTYMVIKTLDGSSCKKCIICTSATYICHTYEKFKKMEFTAENRIDQ